MAPATGGIKVCLTAADFLSVEVYTIKGLVTYYILFFIDIASRSVHIAGITPHPDNRWMTQIARNVTDAEDGILRGKRYLILDRDTKYTDEFRNVLVREGIHLIRLPPRSPNLNAFAERFVRSIKSECLNRMIFFGQASLRHTITQYLTHYHDERNHQGRGNQLLRPHAGMGDSFSAVQRRQRLGGMLSYYHRHAAEVCLIFRTLRLTTSKRRLGHAPFKVDHTPAALEVQSDAHWKRFAGGAQRS